MNNRLILILFLAGLALIFTLQNTAVVEIQFLFWSIQMSRSLLIFLLLAIGIVLGWFLHGYHRSRQGKQHALQAQAADRGGN